MTEDGKDFTNVERRIFEGEFGYKGLYRPWPGTFGFKSTKTGNSKIRTDI